MMQFFFLTVIILFDKGGSSFTKRCEHTARNRVELFSSSLFGNQNRNKRKLDKKHIRTPVRILIRNYFQKQFALFFRCFRRDLFILLHCFRYPGKKSKRAGEGSVANLHLIVRTMWRVFARVTGRKRDEKNSRRKQRKKSVNSVWKSFLVRILTSARIRTLSSFRLFRFWLQKGEEEKSSKRFRAGCSYRFLKA